MRGRSNSRRMHLRELRGLRLWPPSLVAVRVAAGDVRSLIWHARVFGSPVSDAGASHNKSGDEWERPGARGGSRISSGNSRSPTDRHYLRTDRPVRHEKSWGQERDRLTARGRMTRGIKHLHGIAGSLLRPLYLCGIAVIASCSQLESLGLVASETEDRKPRADVHPLSSASAPASRLQSKKPAVIQTAHPVATPDAVQDPGQFLGLSEKQLIARLGSPISRRDQPPGFAPVHGRCLRDRFHSLP